MHITLQANQ